MEPDALQLAPAELPESTGPADGLPRRPAREDRGGRGDDAARIDRADRPAADDAPAGRAKPVSLRDVARLAGVSVATVSMVLNQNPRISRATCLRVQRVMEKIGYQPNRLAQSLSGKYTRVLAILLPALRHAFADAYFGEVISGVCDRAGKLGYKVMLEQAKPEYVKDKQHLHLFERRYVDGLLCMGTNDRHYWLQDFAAANCPVMVVDNHFAQWKLDHVACDYRSGAEQAMNYLVQLGHRHVGLIAAAMEIATAREIRDVYQNKLKALGVEPRPTWFRDGKFTEEGGAAAARQLVEAHPEVTAILCANDKMAVGAMHQLGRMGISVPGEMSVVGFDDLRHAAFINPTLTTIHLPLYQVGALACEKLIERIHGRTERVAETLSTHLVVRDSTAMARTAPLAADADFGTGSD
jgi:DNA-binding LacI/PurR family transcriptional regulator